MLIKQVVKEFGGRVRYVDENFGDSALAERYGVKRYPAVFVDEALIARPQDFFGWGKDVQGKYMPWREEAGHERFRSDLRRMIDLRLRGEEVESVENVGSESHQVEHLPAFEVPDLAGDPLRSQDLAGQLVLVEFWATWCPPCRKTLTWLGEVEKRYGDRLATVAIAVASEEPEVRELAASLGLPVHFVMGDDELVKSFGGLMAVPTVFLFDRQGRTVSIFYGAPDDLHERLDKLIRDGISRQDAKAQ